ncbi:hypothetical protein FRC09_012291 [Ceratobasidium sp. 395]|nr:hypothetical protein FRC09_012291 [Ceratobasidium sp. 395]
MDYDAAVQDWPIHDQFERLIATPLRRVGYTFSAHPVVVIDALDKCEDREEVDDLLKTLLERATGLPIKFVLTSRRDATTVDCAESAKASRALTEQCLDKVFHPTIQEDIRTYLASELQALDLLPNELESLTRQSGGLFRHAAWFVDYVLGDDTSQARERMFLLLDVLSDRDEAIQADATCEAILDAMLSKNFYEDQELFEIKLALHAIICARVPFTVGMLAGLPGFGVATSPGQALRALHPILQISSANELVTVRPKQLHRYVMDSECSRKHRCDARDRHDIQLALACFNLIKSPRSPHNICNLPSSYLSDWRVPSIDKTIDSTITSDLLYACRHWGTYIEVAKLCDELSAALHDFLSNRLLLWMEILSLKRCMRDGIEQLRKGYIWLQCVAYSPSDGYIAIGVGDTIQILDACVRQLVGKPFKGHTRPVTSVAYSPDGAYIVSGSEDATIRIWDACTGQLVSEPLEDHTSSVTSVAYSPDGARILSGSWDRTIRIWNARRGLLMDHPLEGHSRPVTSVSFSPDGARVVSSSWDDPSRIWDDTIRIWDAYTGQPIGQPLKGHTDSVRSVAYSPDGAYIVSGSSDWTIRIWDAYTGQPVGQPLEGHVGIVYSVAFSPTSAHIVSGSSDHTIRIWNVRTGRSIDQFEGHTDSVTSVAYSFNGTRIVSGSQDGTTRIWNVYAQHLMNFSQGRDHKSPTNSGACFNSPCRF